MEDKKKCGAPLKGVCCDVKNCVYHDGDHDCTAKGITVGPSYAAVGTDTACATFKPHENCTGSDSCTV